MASVPIALRSRRTEDGPAGRPSASGMLWIPGGGFRIGSDHHHPEEAPSHWLDQPGFWMERAPVTKAQFRKSVKATGYLTVAERPMNPADYPGAAPERLRPGAIVFIPPPDPVPITDIHRCWHRVFGADWRHPEGPGLSISGREQHAVVHIAAADAVAYAHWVSEELPEEQEWERAA